ncbi:MAG: aminoglycoside phosphotransferase family protein [Bacteroidota bacterium]
MGERIAIQHIIHQFAIKGKISNSVPFGSGHIHDTYRLFNDSPTAPDYLLQRFNHHVFPNPFQVQANIARVSQHILRKLQQTGRPQPERYCLQIIPCKDGTLCYRDPQQQYWRLFVFIPDCHSIDLVDTPEQAYTGAFAFGQFLSQLHDFPPASLHIILPDFNNVKARLAQLHSALQSPNALPDRLQQTAALCEEALSLAPTFVEMQNVYETGHIPQRVTHNDTKFNNLLLNRQGQGQCVIDLDTVMPGMVHYDFGDGIRTATGTAPEDEADLALVAVDQAKLAAYTEGYLDATHHLLQPIELHYLPLAGPLMTYLTGIRFLTDFLLGDPYYKTNFETHNLVRAENQLAFAKMLLAQQGVVQTIIKKYQQ